MKAIPYILLILAFAGTVSCEKIIDINIPEGERKIVVNGLVNPDSLIRINLSRSLSVLETNEFVYLEGANVQVSKDGSLLGILTEQPNGWYVLPGHYPEAGSVYGLEVSYPGLASVSANATLADPVSFSEIDTTYQASDFFGGSYQLSFDFQDPDGRNYYALSITATHKVFDYETLSYLDSLTTYSVYFNFLERGDGIQSAFVEDGAVTYYGSKVFFSDDLFSGQIMDVDIEIGSYSFFDADTVRLDVSLEHVSEPFYLYAISSGKYDQTAGNPFSEPVSVYTNIENGLGIFSGYSFFRRSVNLILQTDK